MNNQANALQTVRWPKNPERREELMTRIEPKLKREVKGRAHYYGVSDFHEDIKAEIQLKMLWQMEEGTPNEQCAFALALAEDSPEAAAKLLLGEKNYYIRDQARTIARRTARQRLRDVEILPDGSIAGQQPSQADVLADVRQPDMSLAFQTQLLEIARLIPAIISEVPNLTTGDKAIIRKELLRQTGIDDLAEPVFNQVAQTAGVSSADQRNYDAHHEVHGQNSEKDRKAWSRARAKILAACAGARIPSLLAVILVLSLALVSSIRLARFDHQPDNTNQICSNHQDSSTNIKGHQKPLAAREIKGHQGEDV